MKSLVSLSKAYKVANKVATGTAVIRVRWLEASLYGSLDKIRDS